jgi:flagellar biosynthetic protein FlhB
MSEQFGDKTHDATPHRRQKAREQGQVARSQDLASALLLVGTTLLLMFLGKSVLRFFEGLALRQLGGRAWLQVDAQFVTFEWNLILYWLAKALLPIMGLIMLMAILVHLAQVGILFLPQKLAPDFSRVDPLKGARRLFSITNLVRLAFGIFKIGVVIAVAYWSIREYDDTILTLAILPVDEIAWLIGEILLSTCLKIGIALLILAILDYGFQKWKHEQDLRMTSQELREEMKTLQGDPQVMARRRQVQRQLVMNRLQSAVPQADVVVTNPTELAIAIQYDPVTMAAPIVVAKGAGVMAQRIRRLALENDVPIVERKPLAQALYRDVDVNHPVPTERYAAVAEVLRYVYELTGKRLPGLGEAA